MTIIALDLVSRRIGTLPGTPGEGAAPGGEAASMRWYGFLAAPTPGAPSGDPLTARTEFLSALTAYSQETCEALTSGSNNPTLTFGAITATTVGLTVKSSETAGRFNTTASGSKFIESYNDESLAPNPIPTAKITFSTAVSAFGAYVTDPSDFRSPVRVWVNLVSGAKRYLNIPAGSAAPEVTNGTLVFLGVAVVGADLIQSVEFVRDDNLSPVLNLGDEEFPDYIYTALNTDQFGLDDLVIATSGNVAITEPGFPYPWPTAWGFETIFGLHVDGLVSGSPNTFANAGALADVVYGASQVAVFTDSAADSAAAGTLTTTSGITGNVYRALGHRLSAPIPAAVQPSTSNLMYFGGIAIDLIFKRDGARVGTGEIVHIANFATLACDASHALTATVHYIDGGGSQALTLTATGSLALGTAHRLRLQVHLLSGGSTYSLRAALFVDGVMVADSSELSAIGGVTRPGTGTAGDVLIGGKDGSNYTPGFIKQVVVSNTIRSLFADYTSPPDPFGEIYPPGMEPGVVFGGGGGGGGGGADEYGCFYNDLTTDTLYAVSGTDVVPFFSTDYRTGRWKSSKVLQAAHGTFAWCKVNGPGSISATVRVTVDGVLVFQKTITARAPVRFPPVRGRLWEVEVVGTGRVTSVMLAGSPEEIRA